MILKRHRTKLRDWHYPLRFKKIVRNGKETNSNNRSVRNGQKNVFERIGKAGKGIA